MPDTLTLVERQVLRCALGSLTHEQTARHLNLSEPAVREIMRNIYRKLEVTTHLELLLCICSGAVNLAGSEGNAA